MSGTLLTSGVVSMATGVAFVLVGRAVARRPPTPSGRLAFAGHLTWWFALGAYLLIQGGLTIVAAYDALGRGLYVGSRVGTIPLLCGSAWGISAYLSYLYTGKRAPAVLLGALYAAVAVLFYWLTFSEARVVHVDRWIVGIDDSDALYKIVYVFVGMPPILASMAYLLLLREAEDPERRWRILLAGASILAYVGGGLAGRLAASDLVVFLTLVVLGLGAALASLAAYYPPAFVRARWERL